MKKHFSKLMVIPVAAVLMITGCKKESTLVIPPVQAHFAGISNTTYGINADPSSEYRIQVGLTTPTISDRTIELTVSSPTGAASGVQYSIPSTSITIPAGEVLADFVVKGIFSGFTPDRIDTLIISIAAKADIVPLESDDTLRLVLRQLCDVVLADFEGDFNNCQDEQDGDVYGPYTISITGSSQTGSQGVLNMYNLWDVGGSNELKLDWSDPSKQIVVIEPQYLFTHPTYGDVLVRGAGTSVFSSCDGNMSLSYEVYVPGVGTFGNFITPVER